MILIQDTGDMAEINPFVPIIIIITMISITISEMFENVLGGSANRL
jgi:hypothetical protein